MKADNICVKCGANLLDYRTECTPLKCARESFDLKKSKCRCEICNCVLLSVSQVCSRCTKGWHNSELRK